jgi:hypothetical protein
MHMYTPQYFYSDLDTSHCGTLQVLAFTWQTRIIKIYLWYQWVIVFNVLISRIFEMWHVYTIVHHIQTSSMIYAHRARMSWICVIARHDICLVSEWHMTSCSCLSSCYREPQLQWSFAIASLCYGAPPLLRAAAIASRAPATASLRYCKPSPRYGEPPLRWAMRFCMHACTVCIMLYMYLSWEIYLHNVEPCTRTTCLYSHSLIKVVLLPRAMCLMVTWQPRWFTCTHKMVHVLTCLHDHMCVFICVQFQHILALIQCVLTFYKCYAWYHTCIYSVYCIFIHAYIVYTHTCIYSVSYMHI